MIVPRGIDSYHLRLYVVRPVLVQLGLRSDDAEELLLGTAAQESFMGTYLKQLHGPAFGIYQMEPATHDDIWRSYLRFGSGKLDEKVRGFMVGVEPSAGQMVWNLAYATAMARVHYYRIREALPSLHDVDAMARYWKRYYNTALGRGTVEEFKKNYARFVQLRDS